MRVRMRSAVGVVAALAIGLGLASCGDDDDGGGAAGGPLVVSAATSLKGALTDYGETLDPRPRAQFAGSDELAAQIRQGVKPDVFASANTKLPDALHREGLVEQPRVFAGNRLVLAVPTDGGRVRSLDDLDDAGVKLAIGSETVPIGSYTRKVLARLGAARNAAILKNVRSNESNVGGVVGKLTQGAADAGFVYITDVKSASGRLRGIELPARLKPSAAYGVAVVKGAEHRDAAVRYIDALVSGAGQAELREKGFEPAP